MADNNDFSLDFTLDDIFNSDNVKTDTSNVDDLFEIMDEKKEQEVLEANSITEEATVSNPEEAEKKDIKEKQSEIINPIVQEEPIEDVETTKESAEEQTIIEAKDDKLIEENLNEETAINEKKIKDTQKTKEEPSAEEAPKDEDIVVETSTAKKKRRRKNSKKVAAEDIVEKNDDSNVAFDSEELKAACTVGKVDETFVGTLCYSLGEKYEEQKKRAQNMMNDIVITSDMDAANIRVMNAKNMEFSHFVEKASDQYIEAYKNLSEKGGLIERVKLLSETSCDGSATDKKVASIIALTNYINPKTGQKVDLLVMQAALRAAKDFWENMRNYSKSVGIALNLANKTSM